MIAIDTVKRIFRSLDDEWRRVVTEEALPHVYDGLHRRGCGAFVDDSPVQSESVNVARNRSRFPSKCLQLRKGLRIASIALLITGKNLQHNLRLTRHPASSRQPSSRAASSRGWPWRGESFGLCTQEFVEFGEASKFESTSKCRLGSSWRIRSWYEAQCLKPTLEDSLSLCEVRRGLT